MEGSSLAIRIYSTIVHVNCKIKARAAFQRGHTRFVCPRIEDPDGILFLVCMHACKKHLLLDLKL